TQGRMLFMLLASPTFFRVFDQREQQFPGAPLLPGDPVAVSSELN
ncbi:hypothetical protein ETH_00035315, partial [Eimeria tenella]